MKIQNIKNLSFGNYEDDRKKAHKNFNQFSYMLPEQKLDVIYEKLSKIEENQRIIAHNQAEMHQFNVESTYITKGLNQLPEAEKQAARKEIDEVKSRVNLLV